MRRDLRLWITAAALLLGGTGCQFVAGAAVGAGGTGAGYEYQRKQALHRLEHDFARGRISKEEYLARKKELEDGSIIY